MVILPVGSLIESLLLMGWVMVPWSSPTVNKSPDPLKSLSHRRSPPSALVIRRHISSAAPPPAVNDTAHPSYYLFSVFTREYRDDRCCSFIALFMLNHSLPRAPRRFQGFIIALKSCRVNVLEKWLLSIGDEEGMIRLVWANVIG